MLAHILTTYVRLVQRHKVATVLNILCLSLGISIFLLMLLFVRFETSFERWLPDSDKVYQVRQTLLLPDTPPQTMFSTPGALLETVQQDEPGTIGVRMMDSGATVRGEGLLADEPLRIVDPKFLTVFAFPLVEGDAAGALARPDSVVLSVRLARKYLGAGPALGKSLTMTINGVQRAYRVTGVLAPMPAHTEVETELMTRLNPAEFGDDFSDWNVSMVKTFLRFETPAEADSLERRFPQIIDRRATGDIGPGASQRLKLQLVPLQSVHLIEPADRMAVAAVGLVALLTLLVACANYVNLATARAVLRAREVAIRKVMGATRGQLIVQFLTESILTVALASLIGLALAELALPFFNQVLGSELEISYSGPDAILLPLLLLIALIGTVAGLYPSFLLSRFEPAAVLASAATAGGGLRGARLREGLVALQFAVAIGFIIATSVIFAQTVFVRSADLGFDRSNLLLVTSFRSQQLTDAQRSAFLTRAATLTGVVGVTQSDAAPGDEGFSSSAGVGRPGMTGERPTLNRTVIGERFFETYGARLSAGRRLDLRFGIDDSYVPPDSPPNRSLRGAMLNEAALGVLNIPSAEAAVGQKLEMDGPRGRDEFVVVGVLKDLRFKSLRGAVTPAIYLLQSRDILFPIAAVRVSGDAPAATMDSLQRLWRSIAPEIPFDAVMAEENLAAYYEADSRRSQLFLIGALMAVFISCLGLYGLAAFTTSRRTKEIGIRRALGASQRDMILLLSGQMVRPVLLANLIAWPIAYLAMRNWLNGFDQRVELGWIHFFLAATAAALIAVFTVASHVLRVSRTPPAQALRYE